MERRAGLAPAFPRRKRDVFPWTTNAQPTTGKPGGVLKIHSTAVPALRTHPDGFRQPAGQHPALGAVLALPPVRRSPGEGTVWALRPLVAPVAAGSASSARARAQEARGVPRSGRSKSAAWAGGLCVHLSASGPFLASVVGRLNRRTCGGQAFLAGVMSPGNGRGAVVFGDGARQGARGQPVAVMPVVAGEGLPAGEGGRSGRAGSDCSHGGAAGAGLGSSVGDCHEHGRLS